jgi:catechol 2,3-dioxygenase-like lactoylglutathione lyase family enzyme
MDHPIRYRPELTAATQVKDMQRSIHWYRETLGFTVIYEVKEMGWCELATSVPGVSLGLSQVESPKVGAGPVLTWGVLDIAAARHHMEERDVRFDGPTHEIPGLVKLATFYDPDGNAFMFAESLHKG